MANANFNKCPHCGKSYAVFQNDVPSMSVDYHPQAIGFWSSDGATYALTGVFTAIAALVVCWLQGWPSWLSPAFGVLAALSLQALKLMLNAPPKRQIEMVPDEVKRIRVDVSERDKNHLRLQVAEDFGVSAQAVQFVAHRIVVDGRSFARRHCTKARVCSQSDFEMIQARMVERSWAAKDLDHPQAGVKLTWKGRAVLVEIARRYPLSGK